MKFICYPSFLIADISAKAVLVGALALSIVKAFNLELTGPASAGIGAATIVAITGTSYLILTGSTGNLVPMGIVSAAGYAAPTFLEYIYHMALPQLIYVIVCTIVIFIFFKPEKEINSKDYFKDELEKLGPLKIEEKKLAALFLGLILLIVTSDFHGISVGWLFVSLIFILFLPGIEVAEQEDFKSINFSFILFVTACLTIGIVSGTVGAGQFIADIFVPLMQGGVYQTISGVWGLGGIANFALTPLAGYSAFTEPLIGIAESLNINFLPMIYTLIQAMENVLSLMNMQVFY